MKQRRDSCYNCIDVIGKDRRFSRSWSYSPVDPAAWGTPIFALRKRHHGLSLVPALQ